METEPIALSVNPKPEKITQNPSSVCAFAAEQLLVHVAHMQEELFAHAGIDDIEHIHRLRVLSRRIRTALALFPQCQPKKAGPQWLRQLRSVTKALGETRDTDVQIIVLKETLKHIPNQNYRYGIQRLLLRKTQRRQKLQKNVENVIASLEKKKVLSRMSNHFKKFLDGKGSNTGFCQELYALADTCIQQRLSGFISFEKCVEHAENKNELHAMRIAAKHLRYAIEIFAPLYLNKLDPSLSAIRKIQTDLGEIHDCDMWIESLPSFIEKETKRIQKYFGHTRPARLLTPGLENFLKDRERRRNQLFRNFQRNWKIWHDKRIWNTIEQIIEYH